MLQQGEIVALNDELLIGRGAHKKVYADPNDFSRCIKIINSVNDLDWKRELRYRKSRVWRGLKSDMIPSYYGTVETTLGTGHSFERVVNFDGSDSFSLSELFEGKADSQWTAAQVIRDFQKNLFDEKIIMTNMEPTNFLLQKISPDEFRVRIVDNVGSPVKIPLMFYIDALALAHVKRYWMRFISDMSAKYPHIFTEELKSELSVL